MALVRDAAYRCDERGFNELPLADNTIVYRHAALGLSGGRVRPIQSGDKFAGFVARRNQDSRGLAAGAPPVQVPIISSGTIELPISGVAATDVGATVYATDDDTFGLTGAVAIGAISGIAAPGVARVAFSALGASPVSGDGGGAISIVSAERSFGIRPGVGVDNTAAFEALCAWMSNIADDGFYVIDFGPGEFYTDHITTLKPVSGSVSATILFSGVPGHTIFTARTSSRPVFFTIHAAYQAQSAFRGFRVQGIGATNPYQDGVAVVSDFRSLDDTAGITNGLFSHVTVRGFHGKAVWMRGGLFEAGRWAWLWPNQFIEFQQCFFESEFDSSFEATGQFGQIGFQGGTLDGNNRTNVPGSGAYIGIDHRNLSHGISAVNGNKFQLSNIYEAPTGTPVRVIGTTLAAPLSTGTTYWAFPVDLNDSASEGRYISLASTRALAGTKTPITITSAGTPSNYRLVWIWATGAPAGNEFTTEFNHRLCTGDKIHLEGTNVPTGTVARTTYYVIRTGHRTFKLAASETNAGNGTAMAVSGGTAADYGFVLNDYGKGPSEMIGAYSVDMRTTTQSRNEGIVVNGSWDVRLNLHVENMITPVRVINSVVSINEGAYQDAAYGIAGEGVLWSVSGANSRVTLYGNISVLGTTERLIANLGNSGGGQVWADGACITGPSGWNPPATQTAGMVRQVGTAGGVLDTGHNSDVFVNASATTINTITSGLTYGRELRLMAFGGSITLGNSGNIKMPSSSVTIPDGGTAVLRRWDTVATWLLVSVNLVPGIGGTKTLAVFTPLDNQPPGSNFATLDTRNSIAVLDFDAATAESAVFVGVIPEAAVLTSGITVNISWAATSATSGDCVWGAQFAKLTGDDLDGFAFDTAVTATTTAPATSGEVATTTITVTTIDSLAAGNCFALKIYRDADAGGDTMTGDAELVAAEIRSAA